MPSPTPTPALAAVMAKRAGLAMCSSKPVATARMPVRKPAVATELATEPIPMPMPTTPTASIAKAKF